LEVVNSLIGEVIVVPVPVEALGHVSTGLERLHQLDNVKVWHIEVWVVVLGLVEVLLCDHDALLEEVFVNSLPVGLCCCI